MWLNVAVRKTRKRRSKGSRPAGIHPIWPLAALLASPGVALHGQSTNSPASPNSTGTNAPAKLPTVVVTGAQDSYKSDTVGLPRLPEPLRDTPQSITVVPRQTMDDQNSTTLRDVLRNVAGISIAAGEGSSQGDSLTLRGFTARNDIFLDGMRDFGSYYRDPFNYQSVDVLEGPESVMFGRGSTGGIINQESKMPEARPFAEGTLALGTDSTRRGTVDFNEPITNAPAGTAFRLNMMGNDSQLADLDGGEYRRYGFAPSITTGLGTDTRMTFSYLHQTEQDTPDYGIPWYRNDPADVPRHDYYGFKDDYLNTQVNIGTIKWEHDFGDALTLRDQARYANYYRDYRITEPKLGTGPLTDSTMITRNELGGDSTETTWWDQLDATAKFQTAFIEHTVVFGAEGGYETADPTRYTYSGVPGTLLEAPSEAQTFSDSSTTPRSIVRTTADSFGLYALETMKLGEHWEISGGGRWDYFDAAYHESVARQSLDQLVTKPSWRAALVYKPIEIGSIYFDYGTSWNPSAETLSLTVGNAAAPPEANETFEFGTKWDLFHERLSVRGSVFRTEKDNARETDPTDSTVVVDGGNQRVDGFELALSGHLTKEWQALASYDYLDGKVIGSTYYPLSIGQPLNNVPRNTLAVWTTYQLPYHLEIGGGLDVVSSRTANSSTLQATSFEETAPGYWTLDAMVKYTVNRHLALQANVYNLTDNYYYDQLHPGHIVPGAGVSGLFSATVKF